MPGEVKLPQLGENIESAKVVKVLVSAGDTVEKDQPLLEVETEKATVEVPSPAAGKVAEVKVGEGDEVKVGQAVASIEGAEEQSAQAEGEEKPGKDGEEKKQEEPAEDEQAEPSPRAEEPDEEEDREAAGGEADQEAEDRRAAPSRRRGSAAGAEEAEAASRVGPAEPPEAPVTAAPSVRRAARELGVDLESVDGSGPGGRIVLDDVLKRAPETGEAEELPDFSQFGRVEREDLSQARRRTAEHMRRCWRTIPHVALFQKADITALESVRRRYREQAADADGRLTITAVLLKVAAAALHAHPRVNASLDTRSGELVLKRYYHIGVAVDTGGGLLVPVIRDVDRKGIVELSAELAEVAEAARTGDLGPEQMQGATFTVTNLGGIGTGAFTPIVNHPEVAILGAGRAVEEPVVVDGELETRLMLPLVLSIDHRALDGADGARFLQWVADALREPLMLSMET